METAVSKIQVYLNGYCLLILTDPIPKRHEKEIHSRDLYMNLSQKVDNASAKETLQELSRQEQGHQDVLEPYLHGEATGGMLSLKVLVSR